MEHRELDAVESEPLARTRGVPRDAVGQQAIEKPGVPRVGDVRAGLDDESRANPGHHGRQAAQMIGVGVGDDGEGERPGAVALKERRDHASPGIGPFARGPGIHQQPMSGGSPEGRGIPLPDVEKM